MLRVYLLNLHINYILIVLNLRNIRLPKIMAELEVKPKISWFKK